MPNHKQLPELTPRQKEIFVGSMLGDGTLEGSDKNKSNWHLSIGQSILDKDNINKISYMNFYQQEFAPHSNSVKFKKTSLVGFNKNQYSYRFNTFAHPIWTSFGKEWYLWENNKLVRNKLGRKIKTIPRNFKLTPLTVCVWFMDDGCAEYKTGMSHFCTNGFTPEECEYLCFRLNVDVDLDCYVRNDSRGYPMVRVRANSYKKLINLMKPHASWECFQYKLNDNYTRSKLNVIGENNQNSKFTNDDVNEMVKLRESGVFVKDIAVKFNCYYQTISNITRGKTWKHMSNKFEVKKRKKLTNEDKKHIIELGLNGISGNEISRQLKISKTNVRRILDKNNIKREPKITDEIKKLVISLKRQNLTHIKIANQLNIGRSSVSRILKQEGSCQQ